MLNRVGGKTIADVTVSQKISFNGAKGQFTYLFGYSTELGQGQIMSACLGKPTAYKCGTHPATVQSLRCGLTKAIGAPWIEKFNAANGTGIVTSISIMEPYLTITRSLCMIW